MVPMSSATTSPSRTRAAAAAATADLSGGVRPGHVGERAAAVGPVDEGGRQHGATVHPGQHAGPVELVQVAPDGGGADVEGGGQVADRDRAVGPDTGHDLGVALHLHAGHATNLAQNQPCAAWPVRALSAKRAFPRTVTLRGIPAGATMA